MAGFFESLRLNLARLPKKKIVGVGLGEAGRRKEK